MDGDAVTPPQVADIPHRAVRAGAGGGCAARASPQPVQPGAVLGSGHRDSPIDLVSDHAGPDQAHPSQGPMDVDTPIRPPPEHNDEPPWAPDPGTARLRRSTPLVNDQDLTGVDTAVRLPLWTVPAVTRSFKVDFSIISQIDGLSAKCLGQGARIERDVMATSDQAAVCHVYGWPRWMSSSAFCGLYFCDFEHMPHVIGTVASHRGYGIFVVPRMPGRYPAIAVLRKNQDGTGVVRRYGWYDYLMSHALLTFDLPVGAFTTLADTPVRHPYGVQAVVAQFGQNGRFKSVIRPEYHFRLQLIPALRTDGPKLGVRPVLLHRASHLATDGTSVITPANDCVPASPAFVVPPGVTPPVALQSKWAPVMHELRELASDYPCQQVAALALEVATDGSTPSRAPLTRP